MIYEKKCECELTYVNNPNYNKLMYVKMPTIKSIEDIKQDLNDKEFNDYVSE